LRTCTYDGVAGTIQYPCGELSDGKSLLSLMYAKQLINDTIPILKQDDPVDQALIWMQDYCVQHLPVSDGSKYVGLLSEEELLDVEAMDKKVGDFKFYRQQPHVSELSHLFEVLNEAADHKISVVPVTGENQELLGVIDLQGMVNALQSYSFISDPGALIMIELKSHDYSLAEIARLVESNDVIILGSMVMNNPARGKVEVSIKINTTDASHVIATLERYEYKILGTFNEVSYYQDLKDRYDAFMRYLNV
jgi:predicted transcriptional regulator